MSKLYDNPKYYEIAFSYRDIPYEVNILEECMKRYSLIPVSKVLELGSGNSPHMEELLKRGYQYYGLDISEEMVRYSKKKVLSTGKSAHFIQADMTNFSLEFEVDFVFVMLGSLYVRNNEELFSHFDSVSKVLKRGGLYLLDWCVNFSPLTDTGESWQMEKDGKKICAQVATGVINKIEQTFEEKITVIVNDNSFKDKFEAHNIRRAIYPQEFLLLLKLRNDFDFIGWWNDWDLEQPLKGTEKINRPIILIRKK